ncbi:MAG: class I SAM-dependent methyltransferase [Agriterribacter sp.]
MNILNTVNVSELKTTGYPLSYLKELLAHKKYQVQIYTTVLNAVIKNSDKPKENIYLIDYGSGNGLLGMFAKFCGFAKVALVDISNEFTNAAFALSKEIKIYADVIICGDLSSSEIQNNGTPDAVVGTDVIEHIYDLNAFFNTLNKLNFNLITVFTTASNNKNWFKKKKLMRLQQKDETEGWEKNNENLPYPSFRELRRKIILETIPFINKQDLEEMITQTRGLNKEDIIAACTNFITQGKKPTVLQHPTNTCDPITGSWTERLLTFDEYLLLYKTYKFKLIIENGYYNKYQRLPKGQMLMLINMLIKAIPTVGKYITPVLFLIGTPLKKTYPGANGI